VPSKIDSPICGMITPVGMNPLTPPFGIDPLPDQSEVPYGQVFVRGAATPVPAGL
jgi:hypothetical protein